MRAKKCFAPTLVVVGAEGSGCEQGARCLWFAIRAKNISPLHWLVVGQTNRVANRYAMWLVAIRAKNISPLHWLLWGLKGRVANRVRGVYGLRFGRKIFRPYIGWWWGRLTGFRTGYAVVMVCYAGEKDFGRTLGCALGGRAIRYITHVGNQLTMRQPSAQGL